MQTVNAVTGGDVVTPEGVRAADVLIERATISRIAAPGTASGLDATGCLVLPGGVDPHTHPLADLGAATTAALHGGTTTVFAFTDPRPGENPGDAWRRALADDLPHANVNVLLHSLIRDPERLTRPDLEELRLLGARSVKLFLAYPELGMMASDRVLRGLGSDAEWTVSDRDRQASHATTPYDGLRVRGKIRAVIRNGATATGFDVE